MRLTARGLAMVCLLVAACDGGAGGENEVETDAAGGAGPGGSGGTGGNPSPDAAPGGTPSLDAWQADAALPPPADALPDALLPDALTPDGPLPDAGPRPVDLLCQPCIGGETCEWPGALCLTNQSTGEQFCGLGCGGAEDCPRGSICVDVGEGNLQCAPSSGTCAGWPPSDLGAPCAADRECRSGADRCVEGSCTRGCESEADCAVGFRTCAAGICRPDWTGGPQGCGLGAAGCDAERPCPDGRTCLTELDGGASLPWTIHAFCTADCGADADCAAGETCAPVGDRRLCLPAPCACLETAAERDLLAEALAAAGRHRCEAIFDKDAMGLFVENVRADPYRMGFFDRVHDDTPSALPWGYALTDTLRDAARAGSGAEVLSRLGAILADREVPVPAAGLTPDGLDPGAALVAIMERLWTLGGRADRFNADTITRVFADVPAPLQAAIARILTAEADALQARADMLTAAGIGPADVGPLFDRLPGLLGSMAEGVRYADPNEARIFSRDLKLDGLVAASAGIARTVEDIDWAPLAGLDDFHVDLLTPVGRVIVQDAGETLLAGRGPYLLVLDTGGNDRYEAPVAATVSATEAVSVLVELGGDDRYGYAEMDNPPEVPGIPPADAEGRGLNGRPASRSTVPRQGTGILGAGLLFDLAGNDEYLSLRTSQGAAAAGVGLLVDRAGDDHYGCEQGCQGAAAFGVAALVDLGGTDRYDGAESIQGYAGVRGVGYLHDEAGDDRYTALPGDPLFGGTILYDNPQNPAGSNSSFGQGAGFGRRADFDGTYASGGLGILQDMEGADVYTVDIFGQGTGYWFGTGVLRDRAGDDTYNGRWYVQGSSAHFAMSLFFEDAGDDRYNEGLPLADGSGQLGGVILATATGQGHDLSLGYLVDAAGNDHYVAPGLGVGGGNDNGIGYFLEGGGDDRYDVPEGTTFGGANTGDRGEPFDAVICMGIFVDADGTDTYSQVAPESPIGNDRTWTLEERKPGHKPGERGAGLDVSGGALLLP